MFVGASATTSRSHTAWPQAVASAVCTVHSWAGVAGSVGTGVGGFSEPGGEEPIGLGIIRSTTPST